MYMSVPRPNNVHRKVAVGKHLKQRWCSWQVQPMVQVTAYSKLHNKTERPNRVGFPECDALPILIKMDILVQNPYSFSWLQAEILSSLLVP